MYKVIDALETCCRLLVVLVFNLILCTPSQLIFGMKNANREGIGLSVRENTEILLPLWKEETIMGRASTKLANWAIG